MSNRSLLLFSLKAFWRI